MPDITLAPRALRLGVAGPVGTGKSSLIATVCRALATELRLGVITNDIYTDEDARFLRSAGVLDPERIRAVETGACPHTAIRDDITTNLLAAEDLERDFAPLDVVLIESGGDNLTATFSPALVDAQIFVLDVAGGGDVARKGGPGIGRADLLVVNKTDLAPYVGVDVAQMVADAEAARDGRAVLALSRHDAASIAALRAWVLSILASHRAGTHIAQDPGPMAPHFHADDEHPEGGFVHSHVSDASDAPSADHEHDHSRTHAGAGMNAERVTTTRIAVTAGEPRAHVELAVGALAPRLISRDATRAHVAVAAAGMVLLGGDHVHIEVDVGHGVHSRDRGCRGHRRVPRCAFVVDPGSPDRCGRDTAVARPAVRRHRRRRRRTPQLPHPGVRRASGDPRDARARQVRRARRPIGLGAGGRPTAAARSCSSGWRPTVARPSRACSAATGWSMP